MPELPEVEMVARHLGALTVGRRLERVCLKRERLVPELTPRQFATRLRGGVIEEVWRRGKHILARLSNGRTWITHLRMSGRFLWLEAGVAEVAHTHAVFGMDNGRDLIFVDPRHFGYMAVVETKRLGEVEALRRLGPEPFEAGFDVDYLIAQCGRSRQAIKLMLLDQRKVVGLGNIYAAEALHRAGIDPRVAADELVAERVARLHGEILAVLREAIEAGSTLRTDPREVWGRYGGGAFEDNWRVYDREGEPCQACGRAIDRVSQGGRSTYYCPGCQS